MRDPKRSGFRWLVAAALAVLPNSIAPSGVAAAPGDLDPTFDGDGMVTTLIGSGSSGQGIAQQADGKLVVAVDTGIDVTVLRYLADGSLDDDFSGDGLATTNVAAIDRTLGLALQSDGKIVVVGSASPGSNADVLLVRYDTDGALDTTFGGGDGIVTTPIGASNDVGAAVRIQGDGTIVVAGSTGGDAVVLRYEDDGTLDATFGGGDGLVTVDVGSDDDFEDLVIDPVTGAITAVGASSTFVITEILVARFLADGSPDATFGIRTFDFGGADNAFGVVTGDAGKVYVSGAIDGDFGVIAIDATGALDPTFGGGGVATTSFTGSAIETANALVRQADGAIVAAGTVGSGSNRAFGLARFAADGTPDPGFGTAGQVTTDFSAGNDTPRALLLQSDGKLVATGTSGSGGFTATARYDNLPPPPTPTPTATAIATPTPIITPACGKPRLDCRTPALAEKAFLQTKDKSPDGKDQLQWKWSKGSITTKADFGAPSGPLATTSYQLCVFGNADFPVPPVLFAAHIPAGGLCDAAHPRDCWKEVAKGYNYKDKDRTPDGVSQLMLREGTVPGAAKIQLKASGTLLDDPTYPLPQTVLVQLRNSDGLCWESRHSAPAGKNTDVPFGQFKDKAD